jgi:hypothetical protein
MEDAGVMGLPASVGQPSSTNLFVTLSANRIGSALDALQPLLTLITYVIVFGKLWAFPQHPSACIVLLFRHCAVEFF